MQSIRNNPLAKKYIDLRISEQVLPIRENDKITDGNCVGKVDIKLRNNLEKGTKDVREGKSISSDELKEKLKETKTPYYPVTIYWIPDRYSKK